MTAGYNCFGCCLMPNSGGEAGDNGKRGAGEEEYMDVVDEKATAPKARRLVNGEQSRFAPDRCHDSGRVELELCEGLWAVTTILTIRSCRLSQKNCIGSVDRGRVAKVSCQRGGKRYESG